MVTTGSEPSGNPPSYPQNGTYADLLCWHMDIWGTRPGGSTTIEGRPWYPQDFCKEVFGENWDPEAARVSLGNWRGNGSPPNSTNAELIEKALFGPPPAFQSWRIDLRLAHKRPSGKGKKRGTKKESDMAEPGAFAVPSNRPTTARFIVRDPHTLDLENRMAAYEESAQLFKHTGNIRGRGEALIGIGDIAMSLEQYDKSHHAYLAALLAFGKVEDPVGRARSYFGLGNVEFEKHNFERARAEYNNSLQEFIESTDQSGQADCYYKIALIDILERKYHSAHENIGEAASLRMNLVDKKGEAECLSCLAYIHSLEGNIREAIQFNYQASLAFRECGLSVREEDCVRAIGVLKAKLSEQ